MNVQTLLKFQINNILAKLIIMNFAQPTYMSWNLKPIIVSNWLIQISCKVFQTDFNDLCANICTN